MKGFDEDCVRKVLTFLAPQRDKGRLIPILRVLRFTAKGWHTLDSGRTT